MCCGCAGKQSGKVVEKSKEGFRQFLLEHFEDPDVLLNKDRLEWRKALARYHALPNEALIEVSKVYTDLAERITGQKVKSSQNPREEIIAVLDEQFGLIDHIKKRKSPDEHPSSGDVEEPAKKTKRT